MLHSLCPLYVIGPATCFPVQVSQCQEAKIQRNDGTYRRSFVCTAVRVVLPQGDARGMRVLAACTRASGMECTHSVSPPSRKGACRARAAQTMRERELAPRARTGDIPRTSACRASAQAWT